MKQAMKGLFSIALLISTAVQATNTVGRSFLLGGLGTPTSNGLIGHADRANRFDAEGMPVVFTSQSQYGQTFKSDDIAKYLFFNGTSSMVVGPVAAVAAGTNAVGTVTNIHSINLLLGTLHESTITAAPTVKTFSSNLNLYVGLNDLMDGLYADLSLPILRTKWDAGLTEVSKTASTAIAADIITVGGGAIVAPYTTAIAALKGDKTIGNVTSAMSYHKIDGAQSRTKVGDAKAVLGYNFINKENCHFGLGLLGVFNGNGATKAEFAFEPNAGHLRHGIGGRVDGHVRLYEKDEHSVTAHIRADVFTTFKRTMRRTYDFTLNGVGSRYNLIKEFTAVPAYAGVLHRGVNLTSLEAKIAQDAVYNADFMLHYTNGNFVVDGGYSLNGHTKEEHKSWVGEIAGSKYGFFSTPNADANDNSNAVDVLVNGFPATAAAGFAAATAITTAMLNKESGLAKAAMTHSVYGNLGYTWVDSEWTPMVAIGGGAQFSGSDNDALNAWNVHFTGGVSF